MYSKMRTIHLCAAMFSLAFLAMYTVSAVQMGHSRFFALRPTVSESRLRMTPALTDARAAAAELIGRGLRGELRNIQSASAERLVFRIVRPGTIYDVDYTAATGDALVKTSRAGVLGYLNRLHHIGGLNYDYPILNVWGVLVGVISLGLFTLGATGLYLWYQNHRERRIGGVLLAGAVTVIGTLVVWMR
jgi:hypothetical protein